MFELINRFKIEYLDFWYNHVINDGSVTNAFIAVCGVCALILMVVSIIDEKITEEKDEKDNKEEIN